MANKIPKGKFIWVSNSKPIVCIHSDDIKNIVEIIDGKV